MVFTLMRQAKIGTKLSVCTFIAVGGLFAAFLGVTGNFSQRQAEEDALREVTEKSLLLNTTVEVLDRGLRAQVASYASVFKSELPGQFSVAAEREVDVAGIKAPVLMLGSTDVNLNFGIPDHFTALTGAYATIFVRQGDDFIRVTTSHKKEDGERAIGTKLDHAHPGYRLMLSGQSYAGAASLFGGQYMTRYDPIKDAGGKVIGILYVGVDFTQSMLTLGEGIKSLKLGEQGGFYVLSARTGKDFGKALIHRQREGQALLGDTDAAGQPFVKAMLEQKKGSLHYDEAGKNGAPARTRIAAFRTIDDWKMLVVGDAYLDEITATAVQQRNRYAVIGLLMVAAVTALLYLLIQKMVARPIGKALLAVETVATGNLAGRIDVSSNDESGRLMASMQNMVRELSTVVTEVRSGTSAITSASRQVAAGNMDLSERTEQQAGALEETASSMEQMNAAVRQNAEHASEAQQLARAASATARRGGQAVEQLVEKMGAMSDSSRRIADIISVIDGIAFQTNILALNAAVEAARAGEQGRGFAVVAAEVRNLAQRTSGAAKEIKTLIGESLEQVNDGVVLAGRAGGTIQDVVAAIVKVNSSIDDISTATQEQAIGIEQINSAILQLDQVTQQNATLVEEAAAAAQNMTERAERLAEVVGFFVVQDGEVKHARGPGMGLVSKAPARAALPNRMHRQAVRA